MNDQFLGHDIRMTDIPDGPEFSTIEYFKSLEKWVQDVTLWQYFNSVTFHSFLLNQATASGTLGASPNAPLGPRRAPRRPVVTHTERITGELIAFLCDLPYGVCLLMRLCSGCFRY